MGGPATEQSTRQPGGYPARLRPPVTSHPSEHARVGAAAQCPFHQVHGALSGRQAASFGPVCPERDVERVRRGVLGKLGPHSPVSRAGSLDAAVNEMAGDRGEKDRMPAHHVVLPVLGHQVQEPG